MRANSDKSYYRYAPAGAGHLLRRLGRLPDADALSHTEGAWRAEVTHAGCELTPCEVKHRMTRRDALVLNRLAQALAGDGAAEINYCGVTFAEVEAWARAAVEGPSETRRGEVA